ncbi:MAG: TolC family protein [Synergistaceae bacterium]|jgi:outer membrane protein TolC|nr:TolC family protein [Synergistaceae bacterium]
MGTAFGRRARQAVLILLFCVILFLSSTLRGGEKESEEEITVHSRDEALEYILSITPLYNPVIFAAMERINQARADVRSAAAKMGPSLSGEVLARINDAPRNQGRGVYSASLNLVQTIFAGGRLTADKKAAELALSATKAESVRTYQNTLNSVRTTYYEVLRALAQLRVANESLNMSKEHLKQTDALYRGGMAPRGDVLRVRVSVSGAEQERIRAQTNLDVNWAALERAVGAQLSKAEILPPIYEDSAYELQPPDYDIPEGVLVERAFIQRPEIQAYDLYRRRAEELVRSTKGARLPQITFSGNYNIAGGDYDDNPEDTWYVQLTLQWLIFDSGEISSQVERLQSAARELLYQMEDLNSQIRQEVVQSELWMQSAVKRLAVAEEQAVNAREDYRLALRRYEAQVGTNLDVLDSRSSLTESQAAYVNAVYDIAIAQSGLIYTMGDDTPQEGLFGGGYRDVEFTEETSRGEEVK